MGLFGTRIVSGDEAKNAGGNSIIERIGSAIGNSPFGQFFGNLWNDFTGKSNTEAQNSAAAALQADAQAFNASEAQKEREWQTMMSNTAYQRSVADLQAAGLNPWLAVGNGASSAQAANASSGIAGAQASNVNALAAVGTAAAGIGILIKAIKAGK